MLEHIETIAGEIDSFRHRIITAMREREEDLREVPSGISRRFLKHLLHQPRT